MKYALIIVVVLVVLYSLIFIVFKITKPEFVKYNDSYVEWYEYGSYPGRYICASFNNKTTRKDGMYEYEGKNGYGDKVFVRSKDDKNLYRIDVRGEGTIDKVNKLQIGKTVNIEFSRYITYDNDSFEDFFIYYVDDIK